MTTATAARPQNLQPLPAPGDLRTLQAFVNTRDHETGDDELDSPVALAVWLSQRDLLPEGTPVDEGAWKNARAMRHGLHVLIWANNPKAELDEGMVEALNRTIGDRLFRLRFAADGSARLGVAEDGWPGAAAKLLISVVEAMNEGTWSRLKTCATCKMVFFDGSRNRAGTWCNVRRCGNRFHRRNYRMTHPTSHY